MVYNSIGELGSSLVGTIQVNREGQITIIDQEKLKGSIIDHLIYEAVFNPNQPIREACATLIRNIAFQSGIIPSSIRKFYQALGEEEIKGFTVPAFNLRGLTYEMARAALRVAVQYEVGAVIFEIARSEITYTQQRPAEYALVVMAAAIKEGFQGPLFLQGDHFQLNAKRFAQDPQTEIQAVKDLIAEAIAAGFYNLDIDASTLVDLKPTTVKEQQRHNFEITAELTDYIRSLEPPGITISIGGEIGEVGGKNSTVEELRAFMDNYLEVLSQQYGTNKGVSKISVQTGTTHGGIPLADGTIASVKLDFGTLEKLSEIARKEYHLAGAVQHGASTLPEDYFDKFPQVGCAEIHLATGFQNILFESPHFPEELRERIYNYIREELANERKAGETEEQFLYKTRKKTLGPFKKDLWDLPSIIKDKLRQELSQRFELLFHKLQVIHTREMINQYILPVSPPALPLPEELSQALA
jgi:fructose/tagatose bisphosphate aldolase